MAPPIDPVEFAEEAIGQLHKRVVYYQKTVWKRVSAILAPLQKFLKTILSAAKELITTVGKKVVDHITSTLNGILKLFEPIKKALKFLVETGKRLLATIRKKVDKSEVIRILKTVVRKYVETFRKLVDLVSDLWDELGILDAAMAVLNKFRLILSMAFSWFDQITGILTLAKKIRTQLQRMIKSLLKERKDAIRLIKDVAKLKVP